MTDALPELAGTRRLLRLRHPLYHSRLSSRITFLFGMSALVLGVMVSAITYYATRSSIVGQYVTAAETTALDNGSVIHADLADQLSGPLIVNNIDQATSNSSSLLYEKGSWTFTARLSILNPQDLPVSLRNSVKLGVPAEQIFILPSNGEAYIAVGQPINAPSFVARYFEVFPMSQAQNELNSLLSALVAAATLTTIVGLTLGRWAARRVLRPLREVSEVARQISEGQIDARIETSSQSDLAILTRSFNRMVDLFQDRLEREERFASDISHELRSPLTTLGSSISILESHSDELPPRSSQALALLSQEVRRFQRMVVDLLEISRIDAGMADFQGEEVYIVELVVRSLERSTSTPPPIETDPDVDQWRVFADKRRFERVIANLLENAERYAGGATRVTIGRGSEGHVRVAIEDEGPGVPEIDRTRIFDRFARAASSAGRRGAGGGTGLGLALVSEHVKLHGGAIWAESNLPNGSRFVVELPHLIVEELPEAER
ncbi:MAG TPA: HAMP domain-containing sensor histidine kinase [Acidimicrobiales bacterium]|nr:HAMP domain-containing sensor histidine kinase [Acidimicrobiales bacterium]